MNWIKYAFHWENWNFEPIVYFAHITEFLNLGKARIILLPLHLQMLIMQISTQTDSHKCRKSVTTKSWSEVSKP